MLVEVSERLIQLWSPNEIAHRFRLDHPEKPEMRVSHETVYQSLFVQGRGELRRELARCLRSGRTQRRSQGAVDGRGHMPGMIMISNRPPEIADQAVPGDWESDLVMGAGSRSAIGTLVERTTRFVILLHLPGGKSADHVEKVMRTAIEKLPEHLRRSTTWDQGAEMSNHANFTLTTGIPVLFCNPHSPWQRGSNENTYRLLREYFRRVSTSCP